MAFPNWMKELCGLHVGFPEGNCFPGIILPDAAAAVLTLHQCRVGKSNFALQYTLISLLGLTLLCLQMYQRLAVMMWTPNALVVFKLYLEFTKNINTQNTTGNRNEKKI